MPKGGGELEFFSLANMLAPVLVMCSHAFAEVINFLGISSEIITDFFESPGVLCPSWQRGSEAFLGRSKICAPGAPSFEELQLASALGTSFGLL